MYTAQFYTVCRENYFLRRPRYLRQHQLRAAGDILKNKLACLGFGNFLAKHGARLHDAYKHLGIPIPTDIFEKFSAETAVELFYGISRALREERCIVRISGTACLGYIVGAILMLFPDDTMVSVDNFLIHEGPRRSILIELKAQSSLLPPRIATEDLLEYSQTVNVPIVPQERPRGCILSTSSFCWDGWVADKLRLEFLARGLKCTEELLLSCCALLVLIPQTIQPEFQRGLRPLALPKGGFPGLLGPYSHYRVVKACQAVFEVPAFEVQHNLEEAYTNLVNTFQSIVPRSDLDCCKDSPDLRHAWSADGTPWPLRKKPYDVPPCAFHVLWGFIGWALNAGLFCAFVAPGPGATVQSTTDLIGQYPVIKHLARLFNYPGMPFEWHCGTVYQAIMSTVSQQSDVYSERRGPNYLAVSTASTIYSSLVRVPDLDLESGIQFELVDGQLQHKGRSYRYLSDASHASEAKYRPQSMHRRSLGGIRPTASGVHSSLLFSVEERASDFEEPRSLYLHATAIFEGQNVPIHIGTRIVAAYSVSKGEPCSHPKDSPLDPNISKLVITTSIAAPLVLDLRMSIVQVARNPTAQFLACVPGGAAILQKQCCLNCAFREVMADTWVRTKMIIAG
jgi:hypothetical protein